MTQCHRAATTRLYNTATTELHHNTTMDSSDTYLTSIAMLNAFTKASLICSSDTIQEVYELVDHIQAQKSLAINGKDDPALMNTINRAALVTAHVVRDIIEADQDTHDVSYMLEFVHCATLMCVAVMSEQTPLRQTAGRLRTLHSYTIFIGCAALTIMRITLDAEANDGSGVNTTTNDIMRMCRIASLPHAIELSGPDLARTPPLRAVAVMLDRAADMPSDIDLIINNTKCVFCWSCNRLVLNTYTEPPMPRRRMRCGNCRCAVYCSAECQRLDYNHIHKVVCGHMKNIMTEQNRNIRRAHAVTASMIHHLWANNELQYKAALNAAKGNFKVFGAVVKTYKEHDAPIRVD